MPKYAITIRKCRAERRRTRWDVAPQGREYGLVATKDGIILVELCSPDLAGLQFAWAGWHYEFRVTPCPSREVAVRMACREIRRIVKETK